MRLESANWIKRTASHKGSNANDHTEQELDWELLTSSCFYAYLQRKRRKKKKCQRSATASPRKAVLMSSLGDILSRSTTRQYICSACAGESPLKILRYRSRLKIRQHIVRTERKQKQHAMTSGTHNKPSESSGYALGDVRVTIPGRRVGVSQSVKRR